MVRPGFLPLPLCPGEAATGRRPGTQRCLGDGVGRIEGRRGRGAGPLWCSASSTKTVPAPSRMAAATATHAATVSACPPYTRRGAATGLGKPDRSNGSARRATEVAVPGRDRRDVVHQAQHLLAQPGRQRHERQHGQQHRRAEFAPLARAAHLAVLDVPVHPLAQQDGQVAVPAREDASSSAQFSLPVRATSSAPSDPSNWVRARDASACAWLPDTPSASARSSPSRSCRRFSSMTSRLARVQPGERATDQAAQLAALRRRGRRPARRRSPRPPRRAWRRSGPGAQAAVALVPCHRVQPRAGAGPGRAARPAWPRR